MATWTNSNRNTTTFKNFLRRANDTRMADLANFVFTDVVFSDGTQIKDVTFAQLSDQVWANISRSADPSYTQPTRN